MKWIGRSVFLTVVISLNLLLGVLIATLFFYRDNSNGETFTLSAQENLSSNEFRISKSEAFKGALALQKAYNVIAQNNLQAVVSLQVETISRQASPNSQFFGDDELLRRFFGMPPQRERRAQAFGSGFIISKDGLLVSNHHVVENAEKIIILFKDSDKEYEAEVIGSDPDTDIALLKIKGGGNFPAVTLGDSDAINIGDIAVAIGNPFGLSSTFTTGVISATGRTGIGSEYSQFLQTDVAINPGNSGGPLLNLDGQVVGVNSMIYSRSGGSIGIGFAIPINLVKNIVEQLRSRGEVTRGWLGVSVKELTVEEAEALDLPQKTGLYLPEITQGSPADEAGVEAGDVVLAVNGRKVRDASDLIREVGNSSPGTSIKLKIWRKEKVIEIKATVTDQSSHMGASALSEKYLGVKVSEYTDAEARRMGYREAKGLLIREVERNSALGRRGVREGDIIVLVNKEQVNTLRQFETLMKAAKKNKQVALHIQRGSYLSLVVVPLD